MALQMMAKQTAELHRQFLEGQQKTQQTFLKLLEQEQRLAEAMLPSAGAPAPLAFPTNFAPPQDERATSITAGHDGQAQCLLGLDSRNHDGAHQPDKDASDEALSAGRSQTSAVRAPSLSIERAAEILVEVVADKTGYPADVIGLDMQLDVDLGIDSIKRVEILSAWQDRLPELPALKPEQLGSIRSLRAIVDFVGQAQAGAELPPKSVRSVDAEPAAGRGTDAARVLIEAVADKTGYPAEMLELDMRLDTDLGIDSIKRVEILSAVQERLPDAPAVSPEQLGSFATLRQIALALTDSPPPAPMTSRREASDRAAQIEHVNGSAATRSVVLRKLHPCPRPLSNPEARDPVRLDARATVWITSDDSPLTEAVRLAVIERGYRSEVIRLEDLPPGAQSQPFGGLVILAPAGPLDETFVAGAFRLLRAAGPALDASSQRGEAAFLTVMRLDGTFGVRGLAPALDPIAGALAGLAKTAGLEWPGANCKAVDLDSAIESPDPAARWIVDELLTRGPAEVGLTRHGRTALELAPVANVSPAERRPIRLERGDVVVLSGGARGITSHVALVLAESFQSRLVLLGRSPAPSPEPSWRAEIRDESKLKRALLERSDRARTPREVNEEVRQIMADREIRKNLAKFEAAGSPVDYRSVDVRDQAAVHATLQAIQREYGAVRGLIHGAGALADRRIVDQTDGEFDLVYDTKVKGLNHLFQAIDPESLAFLILFSSSTARFGRAGQVAYAAANEVLNKWAQLQAPRLPNCRVVSYNWGPWAGGMVSDALKPLFAKEGLTLIPPVAGAQLVVDELRGERSSAVEIVVLAEPARVEQAHRPARREVSSAPAAEKRLETVFERTVDLDSLPILSSHVIDGHAVLPMAIILEWLAEGAVHANPGMVLRGVDNLRLYKGVILNDRSTARVEVRVGKAVKNGAEFVVPVELSGTLVNDREVAHARAVAVLGDELDAGAPQLADRLLPSYSKERDEIYVTILFHGPRLQGIERIEGCGERAIAGWVSRAPAPAEWIEQPLRTTWLTEPLAIDSAFQLVVLWSRDRLGANSLPVALGGYRQFRREFPVEGVRVVAEIRQASDTRALVDIEFLGASGDLVARLDSYECVVDSSLNQAFRRNELAPCVHVIPS
jgi:NAD(P)-dependent dehydrogenase (short-subunit alcohol dehydrogenase family)/acyl carrier protein